MKAEFLEQAKTQTSGAWDTTVFVQESLSIVFTKEKQLGKTRTKIRLHSQQPSFVFYQISIVVISGGSFLVLQLQG